MTKILDEAKLRDFGGKTFKQVIGLHEARISRKIACIGDSINAGSTGGSWYEILVRKYGSEFINKGNFAVGGKTTTEIIDEQLDSALTAGANTCFVGGGTNDFAIGVTVASVAANIEYMWTTLLEAGIEPIDTSLMPISYLDQDRRQKHAELNYWRKIRCRQLGIKHVDFYEITANPDGSGDWIDEMQSDELHPSYDANYLMAALARDVFDNNSISPVLSQKDDFDHPSRPIVNGVSFTPASTPGISAGWYSTGTGGTYSIVSAASGEFGNWSRVVCVSAADAAINNAEKTFSSLGWTVGDRIAFSSKVRFSGDDLVFTILYTGDTVPTDQPLYQYKAGTGTAEMTIYHESEITTGTNIGVRFYATGTGFFEISRPLLINLDVEGLN